MNKSELIEKIRQLPVQVSRLVDGLSEGDLVTNFLIKADGSPEWTVAQNVHHLADAHMNAFLRCKRMMTEEEIRSRPYDQDGWAALPEAQSADLSSSLAILHNLHDRWVKFWDSLTEDDFQRFGINSVGNRFTLADQLSVYANHGEAHLDQIKRTLAAR